MNGYSHPKVFDFRTAVERYKLFASGTLIFGLGFTAGVSNGLLYPTIKTEMIMASPSSDWAEQFRFAPTANVEDFLRVRKGILDGATYGKESAEIKAVYATALVKSQVAALKYINPSILQSGGDFMGNFKQSFSLNQDIIGYRAGLVGKLKIDDGFRRENGSPNRLQFQNYFGGKRILYPHGATHIYEEKAQTFKVEAGRCGLSESIFERVYSKKSPLLILEASSSDKDFAIGQSRYLSEVRVVLSQIEGAVTVFGCSLGQSDRYLIELLGQNPRVQTVAISIYPGDLNGALRLFQVGEELRFLAKLRVPYQPLDVVFFDSTTAHVWDRVESVLGVETSLSENFLMAI
jgi:hypothetical protein